MSGDETLLSDTLFSFIISAILAKDGKAHMIWLSAQTRVRIGKRLTKIIIQKSLSVIHPDQVTVVLIGDKSCNHFGGFLFSWRSR